MEKFSLESFWIEDIGESNACIFMKEFLLVTYTMEYTMCTMVCAYILISCHWNNLQKCARKNVGISSKNLKISIVNNFFLFLIENMSPENRDDLNKKTKQFILLHFLHRESFFTFLFIMTIRILIGIQNRTEV